MVSLNSLWVIFSWIFTMAAAELHTEGYCVMYGNCGKTSLFGQQLPCVSNIKAVKPSDETAEVLQKVCGTDFPTDLVCCSKDQINKLGENLKKAEALISSCPACRKNFYDFFCKFTCSPDQATFLNITKSVESIDQHKEVVKELTLYVDSGYAKGFFDSCKEVKFLATNGYAMDLIGGGAKSYEEFLKFLGDEKPLLGGSPFQINYKFNVTEEESNTGIRLRLDEAKSCNDTDYKCSCSDCSASCPILPEFDGFDNKCMIGSIHCFSFGVITIWTLIFIVIGGLHAYWARKRINLDSIEGEIEAIDSIDIVNYPEFSQFKGRVLKSQQNLIRSLENIFENIGIFCSSFPKSTIAICLFVVFLLSSGVRWLDFETDPVKLWVSPSEPALKQMQYFESNFGEWYRVEQLIISSKDDSPILNWENIQWWFEKELQLQEFNGVPLSDLCFKPMGDTCLIESFTQYFQGDIGYLNENNWANLLKGCTDSPVNCLPTFQQPLKKNILFDNDNIFEARAFVITLLLNKNLEDEEYTSNAVNYEHGLRDWAISLGESTHLKVDISTEISLTEELNKSTNSDVKIIIISYLFMFVYASLALGGTFPRKLKHFVDTRFLLAMGGIIIILLSVTTSVGFFSILGLKSTLIIAEVIPFLILAIGIDNIFLILHELEVINNLIPDQSIKRRVGSALGNVGPSCFISAILQSSMFLLAAQVEMPAVKNFAYYSAGAIVTNFVLQMTGFVSLLALDQKRKEDNRLDVFPWMKLTTTEASESIEESDKRSFITKFIAQRYAPFILSQGKKLLAIFILWLGISLYQIPSIEFGLDQRIALPSDSYLIEYFNSVYDYLNVGPPLFIVLKDIDLTNKENQKKLCGKFSGCKEYSIANIIEQEHARGNKSTVSEPVSSWIDDFFTWLNPDLDQCCRFKKNSPLDNREFCSPYAPDRTCETCYATHVPPYSSDMEGFPTDSEFMFYFQQWIQEPSDPCPLGGKAPYSNSISYNDEEVIASYFRTSHNPLRSQQDFIMAYKNSLRIVEEIKEYNPELDVYSFSPFYIFFVQYISLAKLTFMLLVAASIIIWSIAILLLGSISSATIMIITIASIMINMAGVLSLWSISLNAVSLVNLIICVGLAVEFTIHITRAFTSDRLAYEEDHDNLFAAFMQKNGYSDPRVYKIYNVLVNVGSSVVSGITLTKIIGVFVLAFTRSKIFEIYYFRMWLSLVFIAAIHSLCLLPILLSILGNADEQHIEFELYDS